MNHSVDTTPLTKAFTLKNKTSFISKVNMKSFLLKNGSTGPLKNGDSKKIGQSTDADRASQRSIVESTNAYIKAAKQAEDINRIHYLQSAGAI